MEISQVNNQRSLSSPFHPAAEKRMAQEFHVLAVDDSFVDRKVIERLLKVSSCKVTAVESAGRALQFLGLDGERSPVEFDELKVNLIITDYSMPEMTGYDLLKRIKGSKKLKEIPVVIMSSEDFQPRVSRCLEEGAEEYLVKPVKLSDVVRLRDFILREKAPPPPLQREHGSSKRKLRDEPPTGVCSPSTGCDHRRSLHSPLPKRRKMVQH